MRHIVEQSSILPSAVGMCKIMPAFSFNEKWLVGALKMIETLANILKHFRCRILRKKRERRPISMNNSRRRSKNLQKKPTWMPRRRTRKPGMQSMEVWIALFWRPACFGICCYTEFFRGASFAADCWDERETDAAKRNSREVGLALLSVFVNPSLQSGGRAISK